MPLIMSLFAIAVAGYFWMNRARNAAHIAGDLAGMAQDVLGAARRFGFRRQANIHPVESLQDGNVAVAALGIGYLELGGLPRAEQQEALLRALQVNLAMSHDAAQEAVILGRWLIMECGGAVRGMDRIGRRLYKLQGAASFEPLMHVVKQVAEAGGASTNPQQSEALEQLAQAYRIRPT